jgi:hypothetical protein
MAMKRYPIYMLLALLFALQTLPLLVNGQSTVGNEEYDHHSYQEAIRKYKIAVAKNPDDGELLFRLADSYRRLGQMREAERWFEQTLQHSDNSRAHLYYAQALLSNRKYAAAKEAFVHYARLAESETDANHAQMIAIACEKLATNGTVPSGIKVQKADFNSDQLDFSPVIWKENSIVFASNRPTARTADEASDPWTEAPFVDLWVVDVAANGKTGEPRPFAKEINSQFHEGPIVFNTSGDRVYLTRSDVAGKGHRGFDDKKNTRLKIYSATRIEDKWVMEPELSINSSKFSTCHPALSLTEDTLVFSSDRPGGIWGYGSLVCRQGRKRLVIPLQPWARSKHGWERGFPDYGCQRHTVLFYGLHGWIWRFGYFPHIQTRSGMGITRESGRTHQQLIGRLWADCRQRPSARSLLKQPQRKWRRHLFLPRHGQARDTRPCT